LAAENLPLSFSCHINDQFKLRKTALSPASGRLQGVVMLGPMDLEDWLEGDEDDALRTRLQDAPAIKLLGRDATLCELPGLDHFAFALARRFSDTDYLDSHELRMLADQLGV
jgi:hypothetical protein